MAGCLAVILLPAWMQAQQDEDSVRMLSEEMDRIMVDTPAQVEPPAEYEEDDDQDEPATSVYFMRKDEQVSGGGPDTVYRRQLADTFLSAMKKDGDFWYVNYPFGQKEKKAPDNENEKKRSEPLTASPVFETILWVLIIGGFVAFVIIYLANSNVSLFRKKSAVISPGDDTEAETGNIFEINYQKEIDKAVSNGNYRFAVRLMFLRLLKNLADKNIIQYKPERTDFDYLLQLHSTRYYNDFFRLTRNYEYCWYGQFDVDHDRFTMIRKDFDNFDNKLKY